METLGVHLVETREQLAAESECEALPNSTQSTGLWTWTLWQPGLFNYEDKYWT